MALAGPKKPCGQGGCGGCTVILSRWNEKTQTPEHRAINSCLRPVCALGGLVVTTVEGTGAVRKPDPPHLLHSLTASRFAAPIGAHASPVLANAVEAAAKKRRSVKAAVDAARARKAAPAVVLASDVADHPSEHSHAGMNPVAHRLALNNGSQCGYCSVGFVMNMSEFIVNHPKATKQEIEEAFDGNLCRCTGYRAILTGMKTFASDWTRDDEKNRMKCLEDDGASAQLPADVVIPFPAEARGPAAPVSTQGDGPVWRTPTTLDELAAILHAEPHPDEYGWSTATRRMASTRTSIPRRRSSSTFDSFPNCTRPPRQQGDDLVVPSGTTYSDLIDRLAAEMKARKLDETTALGALAFMARRTAGRIVRNAATIAGNTMLVLKHIAAGTGEPFPSDLFTALVAVDARSRISCSRPPAGSSRIPRPPPIWSTPS